VSVPVVIALAMLGCVLILTWRTNRTAPANEPDWMRNARIREQDRLTPRWVRWVAAAAVLSFLVGIATSLAASSHNPRQPDPLTGHLYPINNHGFVVYVTRPDYLRINGMIWADGERSLRCG
jgi:hypothetical protein